MDGGQKTSDRANCKGQLVFTGRGERRLRRIVRSLRSQKLAQITTQLNDGASPTVCVKDYHTASTNHTELWTVLANIWQVTPVKLFQKLAESMLHRVVAVIKPEENLSLGERPLFQEDNASVLTSRCVQTGLHGHDDEVVHLTWCPQSPELNII
ncbi:hypothetical protein TNCV_1568761 [Trichonephila clavipes]|nr:hypothetical protein TNCV_1568761 [Trichonephila clavipes]